MYQPFLIEERKASTFPNKEHPRYEGISKVEVRRKKVRSQLSEVRLVARVLS